MNVSFVLFPRYSSQSRRTGTSYLLNTVASNVFPLNKMSVYDHMSEVLSGFQEIAIKNYCSFHIRLSKAFWR